MNNGRILKKKRPFTQVSNSALRDPNLSLKAKGLYALINSYIDIPDFTLYKPFLIQQCQEGKAAFQTAWDELKKAGYLIQRQVRNGNRFNYEYELLDEPEKNSQHTDFQDAENEDAQIQDTQNQDDINNTESKNTDSNILNKQELNDILLLLNINSPVEAIKVIEKFNFDEKLTYYDLGIVFQKKPENPVGYLNNIFINQRQNEITDLTQLKIHLPSQKETEQLLQMYTDEVELENLVDETTTLKEKEFLLLTKILPYAVLKKLMRNTVVKGNSINSIFE